MTVLNNYKDEILSYLKIIGFKKKIKSRISSCYVCNKKEYTVLREKSWIAKKEYSFLPVVICNCCGALRQLVEFEKKFYSEYYKKIYSKITKIWHANNSLDTYFDSQIKRGNILYQNINKYFKNKKDLKLLDVGCGPGGMMTPFIQNNWSCIGIENSDEHCNYGKKMGIPLKKIDAENFYDKKSKFDLIVIIGSLEHVYNPNKVMENCKKMIKRGGYLLLEGKGKIINHSTKFFNHNHHRIFSRNSIQLMMLKYNFEPIFTTFKQICGSFKGSNLYCFGKFLGKKKIIFKKRILILKDSPNNIINKYNLHDFKIRKR